MHCMCTHGSLTQERAIQLDVDQHLPPPGTPPPLPLGREPFPNPYVHAECTCKWQIFRSLSLPLSDLDLAGEVFIQAEGAGHADERSQREADPWLDMWCHSTQKQGRDLPHLAAS